MTVKMTNRIEPKNDVERAMRSAAYAAGIPYSYAREFMSAFLQSLAIDEDKAVEEMARGIYEGWHTLKWHDLPSTDKGEHLRTAEHALHASPYYKLFKMMGEVDV